MKSNCIALSNKELCKITVNINNHFFNGFNLCKVLCVKNGGKNILYVPRPNRRAHTY